MSDNSIDHMHNTIAEHAKKDYVEDDMQKAFVKWGEHLNADRQFAEKQDKSVKQLMDDVDRDEPLKPSDFN